MTDSPITGKTLIEWGFMPGKWFQEAILDANVMREDGLSDEEIRGNLSFHEPQVLSLRTNPTPFNVYVEPETDVERENVGLVIKAMDELMRLPTVEAGVIMPDACPAGVIPVGGVVAARDAIHPGFHSSDVCCSMAITVFKREMDLKSLLDAAHGITHFGPGGRKGGEWTPTYEVVERFRENRFLADLIDQAYSHMGTQGDGNHFLYVGTLRSTGQPAIVTHHGSRGVGAMLYKRGMAVAKRHTRIVSPRTPEAAAWIDANSDDGRSYWDALQAVRSWTKENHFQIHDRIQKQIGNKVEGRFWNEHNFVFRKSDGVFYHAKGATPSYSSFSPEYDVDDDPMTLIPLNMSEPILITRPTNNQDALGFAPHGAGRNMSRTRYLREVVGDRPIEDVLREETKGLDVRFWMGIPDASELPGAYKSASQVVSQIERHRLADVVDYVDPYGCLMAGDWERDAPWRRAKTTEAS